MATRGTLINPHTNFLLFIMSLPKAPFEKILKHSRKDIRVSDAAAEALSQVMAEAAASLAKDAAELAIHAGRKTILKSDVELAAKRKS